jgi:hypothetical protein
MKNLAQCMSALPLHCACQEPPEGFLAPYCLQNLIESYNYFIIKIKHGKESTKSVRSLWLGRDYRLD